MSDLRARIACVLAGITLNNTPKPEYLEMADAVIRELERCLRCEDCEKEWLEDESRWIRE